jgi:hypothetical protein
VSEYILYLPVILHLLLFLYSVTTSLILNPTFEF